MFPLVATEVGTDIFYKIISRLINEMSFHTIQFKELAKQVKAHKKRPL